MKAQSCLTKWNQFNEWEDSINVFVRRDIRGKLATCIPAGVTSTTWAAIGWDDLLEDIEGRIYLTTEER